MHTLHPVCPCQPFSPPRRASLLLHVTTHFAILIPFIDNSVMPNNDDNCALICCCSQRGLIPAASVDAAHTELSAQGWQTRVVPDLCDMATQAPHALRVLAETREFLVVACRPRATRWLLHLAGVSRSVSQIQFQDLRPGSLTHTSSASTTIPPSHGNSTEVWPAWFPVIDYERCTGCRQCVNFCAFGVYSVSGKEVRVTAPANCKDNCPACARICPTLAIIFPKVPDSPINGDEVTAAHVSEMKVASAAVKRDHASGNLHAALAARRALQAGITHAGTPATK